MPNFYCSIRRTCMLNCINSNLGINKITSWMSLKFYALCSRSITTCNTNNKKNVYFKIRFFASDWSRQTKNKRRLFYFRFQMGQSFKTPTTRRATSNKELFLTSEWNALPKEKQTLFLCFGSRWVINLKFQLQGWQSGTKKFFLLAN